MPNSYKAGLCIVFLAGCGGNNGSGGDVCVAGDGIEFPGITSASPACGKVRDDLVNKAMAIGVSNNSNRAPNSAPVVHLNFNERDADLPDSEAAVVAVAAPEDSFSIDGKQSDDAEWAGVPSTTLSLRPPHEVTPDAQNPLDLESIDHGITSVDVQAAYDSTYLYMRLQWDDATQNDMAERWTYTAEGWQRGQGPKMNAVDPSITHPDFTNPRGGPPLAMDSGEDELMLIVNKNIANFAAKGGCGGMCHMPESPGEEGDESYRTVDGTKYVTPYSAGMAPFNPGETVDSWVWRAASTDGVGLADDMYMYCEEEGDRCLPIPQVVNAGDAGEAANFQVSQFGPPSYCTPGDRGPPVLGADPAAVEGVDGSSAVHYFTNEFLEADSTGTCVSEGPSRKPADDATDAKWIYEPGSARIGKRGPEAELIDEEDTFEEGDTLPGFIHRDIAGPDDDAACARCNIRARGYWRDGTWTVELKRTLVAPEGDYDADFTVDELAD